MLTCCPHCLNACRVISDGEGAQSRAVVGDPATVISTGRGTSLT